MLAMVCHALLSPAHSASLPMRRHILDGLVNPLKRIIYARIDDYAHSVMLFLWHEFNSQLGIHLIDTDKHAAFAPSALRARSTTVDSSSDDDNHNHKEKKTTSQTGDVEEELMIPCADLQSIKERLERTNVIPEGRKKVLLSLLGDIHYIDEMKRLEQDFFVDLTATAASPPEPKQKKAPPSDIVPITGLIVGKLHRLENELKTVVEHWSRRGL
jgi:hypothetical protein